MDEGEPLRDRGEPPRFLSVFRGKQIGTGKKSVAFSLVYRSPERTLTDEEVHAGMQAIIAALATTLNAVQR